ncbi:hypothetical protein K440DRAFT_660007 [Wilcoxina mikolae CBS 423.85]|nr:hypothetical protein K440DRAFT_660007 [Wilcoxina mikolae CBS 423.85]
MMLYKIGFESFVGSITNMALELWGGDERYGKLGTLHGLNLLFQCIGGILSAQVLRRLSGRQVLVFAVTTFAMVPSVLMILDKCSGGSMKKANVDDENHGGWNTNALFPLYCISGVCYGMIELLKRIIPREIVGGDVDKLRQIDSLVHIFYESAGTGAALFSSYLLLRLGSNYGMIMAPLCFIPAAILWWNIGSLGFERDPELDNTSFLQSIKNASLDFGRSIWLGGKIIFSQRKFAWLPIGYSLALYAHRYLENGLVPVLAQGYFRQPAFAQILVGGSNFGELLGALLVLLTGNLLPTPIPWLRVDALLLCLVWILPFYKPDLEGNVVAGSGMAWKFACIFIPISLGWAAGDVSMVAYIQSSVPPDNVHDRISSLAAVMSFLYSIYIVIFAVMTPALGKYADDSNTDGAQKTIFNLGGVQFSIIAVLLLVSTLLPDGSWRFNPRLAAAGEIRIGNMDEETGIKRGEAIMEPIVTEREI